VFKEAVCVLKLGGWISISYIVTEGEFSDELRADAAKLAECVTDVIDVDVYMGMMCEASFRDI